MDENPNGVVDWDMRSSLVLKFSCPDRVGLLAALSGFFAERNCNLLEVQQYTDTSEGWFFSRVEFALGDCSEEQLLKDFAGLASRLGGNWLCRSKTSLYKVAIMCTQASHCLADLLWRWRDNDLRFDLKGVISNRSTLSDLVVREGVPFVHIPMETEHKDAGFRKVEKQLCDWEVDVVVLARYMQIIPKDFCSRWDTRIINIHHSFLPAFAGARPYLQAYRKGVKLIGATCHYVTEALDEGPIIDQEVVRVGHTHSADDMVRLGQDCERVALARGLRDHLEDRVFCHKGKTVVFRD